MKARSTGNTYTRGIATLEILIAFAIVILCIGSVMLVVFGNQSVAVDSQINNEAIYKAKKLLEDTRALSRFDFNLINPNTSSETSDGITFTRKLEVRQVDIFTKQATSTVSWNSGGRNLSVFFTTFLSSPQIANGGSTCSSILSNPLGWKNPQYYAFPSVNFGGSSANGIELSDLAVFNKKLYVVAIDTPNPSPQSFFVLSMPDDPSQNPVQLGSVDNNASSLMGLSAVKVSGNYAYVSNAYTGSASTCTVANNCAQLQVINVSNPANPTVVSTGNVKIPSTTSAGKLAAGKSLYYYKGYVYVGLSAATGSGNEFNVIDVGGGGTGASPTNPILKGGYHIGHDVNDIFVKDNYAYIASPDTGNLIILDISNPSSPTLAGSYTPTAGLNNGERVSVIGNTAYIGRTFGSDEFQALNISNPASVSLVGKKDIGTTNQTSINGLLVRDYLAFFITLDQFQVWNITDPNNIVPWTSDGTTNSFLSLSVLGGSGTATNCEGDRIYVAVASSQGNNKDILGVLVPGIPSVYTLSNSGNISVVQGSAGNTNVTRTLVSGTPNVSLSASGLPAGATATFTNNPCTATCTSTVTISTTFPTTPANTYPITITGNGNVTTTFNLVVSAQPFDYTLSNTGNITVVQGASGNNTINRTLVSGTVTPVTLTASGLPAGATVSFTNTTCSPTCSSVLTINTTAATPTGNHVITVTGSPNGTGARTTTFTLTVNAPFDYTISNNGNITVARKNSGSNTITRTLVSGVSVPVTLTVSSGVPSIPNQTTFTFSTPTCNPTCVSTLTVSPKQAATPGTYILTVTGSPSGTGPRSTQFTLIITP